MNEGKRRVWDQVFNQVQDAVWDQVMSKVGNKVEQEVSNQQVVFQVREKVFRRLEKA